ncbi:hypothetical protein SZ25_00182 [Candidatus Arcanobacter lacustris]|jgi:hypothetical protein|uniref:Uncharacterized protein n=1 Tax=Candidatus Arcanibacter lacustris TaxID=1607817 RepID=A0A0F5MPL3_9RICK|nr:hypothetical protein SZ25_00182 [Candidatus Arcanobacter lacustris]
MYRLIHTTSQFLYDTSEGRHPGENFVFEKDKRAIGSTKILNFQQSTIKNKEKWILSLQFIFLEDKYRSRMTTPYLSQNFPRCLKNCGVV